MSNINYNLYKIFCAVVNSKSYAEAVFEWAKKEATEKKKQDFSMVEFLTYNEGTCVQCMHIGSYDTEPDTISLMHKYMIENGYDRHYR